MCRFLDRAGPKGGSFDFSIHYPLPLSTTFKSRSSRSNAFLYDSRSLHLPNSPIYRVRRMSAAAHAFVASITASSTRMGNSTGFPLLCSRSKAACTPRSTHGLITEFPDSTSSSLSCTRIDFSISSWNRSPIFRSSAANHFSESSMSADFALVGGVKRRVDTLFVLKGHGFQPCRSSLFLLSSLGRRQASEGSAFDFN